MQGLLVKYAWILKIVLSGLMVIFIAWSAKNTHFVSKKGWKYLSFPIALRILAVAFLLFMGIAVVVNGAGLFQEKWWVVIGFSATFVVSVYFFYITFGIVIRWNDKEIQKRYFPGITQAFPWADITNAKFLKDNKRIKFIKEDGATMIIQVENRGGLQELVTDTDAKIWQ